MTNTWKRAGEGGHNEKRDRGGRVREGGCYLRGVSAAGLWLLQLPPA